MSSERHEALIPILFVDDEPATRRAFARDMAARGFEVDLAADATEALELAARRDYASIATDLNMPGLNGLRLIERLRELQQNTTYILVTGVRELNLPRSPSADCITSVVTKPWDAEELAQCIWHGVQLRRERETGWYEPATDPGATALGGVLVLGHDPFDPDFMRRALVAAGLPEYQVIQSERLAEALAVAQVRQLQVILTELSLPDARGLDAIRALRAAAPHTPLVVLGKQADEALALQALRAGAQDYLIPEQLTAEGLRRALRFAIERQHTDDVPRSRSIAPADSSYFPECVAAALARAGREGTRVAVMYVDVRLEGAARDVASRPLSGSLIGRIFDRIRTSLRQYDTLAYLGDNRIAVVLPAMPAGDRAGAPARRLLAELRAPLRVRDVLITLDVSLGIGVYPDDADTAEELCRCADMAGYRARALGSGACEFFDEQCQASSRAREALDAALDRALSEWEFVLRYRPQHAVDTGSVAAAEVVLSWQRPDGELWDCERFMAALDERGLATRLTGWMLREACYQGKGWQEQHPGLVVALDLSATQLQDPALIDKIELALTQSGLQPELLELEIPEGAVEQEGVPGVLDQLAELGVRLTIDDFGHQLSLARLSELPISAIKIGPSLADLAGNDERGAALIRATAHLSRDLDIALSAMGVDEPGQLDFLQQVGCARAQGELYGPPRTAEATWLSAG